MARFVKHLAIDLVISEDFLGTDDPAWVATFTLDGHPLCIIARTKVEFPDKTEFGTWATQQFALRMRRALGD